MALLQINRNDIIWSMGQWTPHVPARNVYKPVLICHWDLYQHEQWMSQSPNWNGLTYMTPFSKWPSAKWNCDFVYKSAARIDINNICQMSSYLGHLASCHLPTATWAGINDPCSLPSIIVRGPAVTQNKYQLVYAMNEVWCSDVFAPKFVVRKVFSIERSQLIVGNDGVVCLFCAHYFRLS